jgi:D-alanine transaminase
MAMAALIVVLHETARRNRFREGIVYLQISRGVTRRNHPFPKPDIRWDRWDIKSIALLPNVLVKQVTREKGAFESWQVDPGGFCTEGGSTNAWIIDGAGSLITLPVENAILNGITRRRLFA